MEMLRVIHGLWARLLGYFWMPCPLCGEYFGGHEHKRCGDLYERREGNMVNGSMVCPNCKEEADRLNRENGFIE